MAKTYSFPTDFVAYKMNWDVGPKFVVDWTAFNAYGAAQQRGAPRVIDVNAEVTIIGAEKAVAALEDHR